MRQTKFDHWPKGVPESLPVVTNTLDDNLRNAARTVPQKTALIYYGATKTYAQLDTDVTCLAAHLQSVCGVKKGDRVGVYMQNAPQFVVAFYGVIRAGGVIVPINAMHLTEELDYICKNAGIRTLIAAQDVIRNIIPLMDAEAVDHVIATHYGSELPENLPFGVPDSIAAPYVALPSGVTDWAAIMEVDTAFEPVTLAPEDRCIMPYTSGSTGRGKGCVHTHQSAQHAINCIAEWFGYTGEEVHLGATPMFHIVGMQGIMNVSISKGATVIIMSRWDRVAAADMIARYKATTWCTVPTAVIDLLNTPNLVASDLASLDLIYGGGSAMPEAVAKRLRDLTDLEFVEVYGMTESMGPVTHNPFDAPKSGCVGIPVMNTDLLLLDPDTLTPVSIGEVGEIAIHGPQIMQSYWDNPTADAESFTENDGKRFLRTGDLATQDVQGNIVIVDRLKRMINASGYKVWPAEVEAHLYHHPAIAEACVIGAKDAYRGETVKALVVLKKDAKLEAADFKNWAQGQMAAYKVPRVVDVVESLPKSAAGKILWKDLQDQQNAKDSHTSA